MKSRLIIADDHPMVCQGLSDIVQRMGDAQVVATAHDGHAAELLARNTPADLLILDIALPGKSGIAVLEALRADGVELAVLFFSMYPAEQYVPFVRRLGARGFLGKEADEATLAQAVRRILAGQTAFPAQATARNDARASGTTKLSARENDVLRHLLQGVPLVRIAAELGVSTQSVTTYRRRLLDKLDVKNNAELIALINRQT